MIENSFTMVTATDGETYSVQLRPNRPTVKDAGDGTFLVSGYVVALSGEAQQDIGEAAVWAYEGGAMMGESCAFVEEIRVDALTASLILASLEEEPPREPYDSLVSCPKGAPGCLCGDGWPPEQQCPDCREEHLRSSRCVCLPGPDIEKES